LEEATAPLDLAIVGCGRVVERYHVPALARTPEWNLVGACDPRIDRREWIRRRFARIHVAESITGLLEGCRPDAVLVATPPSTHCAMVLRALETGVHVLVEKPMALTAPEADLMCAMSLRVRKRLGVGFSRRFRRTYLELRERLAPLPPREVQWMRFDLVGNAAAWKTVVDFLGDDRRGGGVLDDLASHQMDLLPWLVRARVSRVRARPRSADEASSKSIVYELEFEDGLSALCRAGHDRKRDDMLQVELRDRRLVAHADRIFELRRRSAAWSRVYCHLARLADRLVRRQTTAEDEVAPYAKQLRSFAAAVRNEDGFGDMADGADGARVVRMVAACRQSLRSGGVWVLLESSSREG
jgi:predicted dehydrogenase